MIGDEPIWHHGPDGDAVVGWITSGGYAHFSGRFAGVGGYIPSDLAEPGTTAFEIEIIGNRRRRLRPSPSTQPDRECAVMPIG